jgi:hypothetical protein
MNFVVENSNKLQQIGFRREIELSVSYLGLTTHVNIIVAQYYQLCIIT